MYKKILTLIAFVACNGVMAERFDITATVGQIRYHEAGSTYAPAWHKIIWFGLVSPDKTPNCQKYNGQYAITIPDGNEAVVSMVLAAKMSHSEVLVTVDDSVKFPEGGYCKFQYVTIK